MSLKLDKRMLLVLAVFLMLVIIPTSFAEDINDTDAVGMNDASAVDEIYESAVDDVKQSSVDNSSEVLSIDDYGIEITPNTATVDDYTPGESKLVAFSRNIGDSVDESDLEYADNLLLFVNDDAGIKTTFSPTLSTIWLNLNTIPTSSLHAGANTVKLGYTTGDTNYLEQFYTITLNSMTVNVVGSGSGSGEEQDDSIWVNGSYTGDTSTGTKDAPFKTIQAAISSSASTGKTIKIAEGNYVLTSAITISKNIALVGVGSVNITRTGGQLFSKSSAINSISFTGLNFINSYAGSNSVILHDTCTSGTLGTLKFVNCSFIENTGQSIIRAYDNVEIDECVFINNVATASSANGGGGAVVFKAYGSSANIKVVNSIFINNDVKTNLFYDWSNGAKLTTENSYWGSNDKPTISELFNQGTSSTTLSSWAVIDCDIEDELNVGDNTELNIKFKSTSDGEAYADMDSIMPDLTVTLTPTLGTLNPATVTISDNIGTVTYGATTEGDESIAIKEGNQELSTLTFYVDESPVGKVFVDASYNGGDSDGSKAKPYTAISDALDNLGDNTEIVVKKGTYTLDNYAVNSDVIITGKEDNVVITTATTHMTIGSGKTVSLNNMIFKGATTTSIVSSGTLNIADCVFEDNSGTNVISSSEGTVNIEYTVFNNNDVSGKIVDAIAGTVDYNFWGSNTPNVADTLTMNNYVIVNAAILSMHEGNELESEVNHDMDIKFMLNDGSELSKSLHNVTLTLTSTLGEVTDSITLADNHGVAQYVSNEEGSGQIDIKTGDVTLKTFTFTVIERETGRIFVDASYAGDDSDGSKAKPFKTLTEAIAKNNNDGGDQEIIIYEGTYASENGNYAISKNVNITGRGNVVIDVKGFNFNGYISVSYGQSYPDLVLNNLIFTNASRQSMFQYVNDLTLNNCIVTNVSAGSNIIDSARGNVVIRNSSFSNMKFDSNYNLITLYTSSKLIDISNSVFNNITFRQGKYILSGSNVNIDGNFWGTNDPTSLFPSSITLGNWVVVTPTLAETIVQGQTPTLTVEFKLNNGGELTESLPATIFGLTSLLENTFNPETVTITDNVGSVTYNAVNNGIEVINLTSGDNTIETLERTVEEADSPDKIFVDETYTGESDGSKDKPFNNLKDAFDAITSTRNTVVILEGNYAISDYTLNKDVIIRWSKKEVIITATDLVIAADVTLNDLIFKGGNTITVNNDARLTVANTKFINNTGGITSAGDLTISESQFINTPNTITATAGTLNIEFTEFVLSDGISIASDVTGKINDNYWGTKPTDIGGVELTNWIELVITPAQDAVDLNASEKQTFEITFKNTTDGSSFTDLAKEMPTLDIAVAPAIGSFDKTSVKLSDSVNVVYTATTEGAETINITTEGLTFETLEFDVGKSVAGKIFVDISYAGGDSDGSRLKPFTDLDSAISAARSGNEIIINEGTYTIDSYYSLYNSVVFTGIGEVILTRTPSTSSYSGGQLFSITSGASCTFNNIAFANIDALNSYYSYGSVFYINSYDPVTLNFNNCTFENNSANRGVIYQTNSYGYLNLNIQGSKFINNTATTSYLIQYYGGSGYSLTIANSVFINNEYANYVIYNRGSGYASVNLNNNFWGSNELPSDATVASTMPTTWVIVEASIDADTITSGETHTVTLTFNSTDGSEIAMPDVEIDLSSVLNTIDATATISNNVGEVTYNAVKDGDEVITFTLGDNQLANLTFIVEEKDDGTKVFVDETYTGESDGSKDKPYNNLKDAFDSAKETGKKYISVAEGSYEISNYEIASDVEITGKKVVIIKATDLVIGANVIFNNIIFNDGNAITLNADKNLSVYDSTFTNNDGVILSNGNLLVNATQFINNGAIDGKGIINALSGTIKIAYSEFVNCDDGSVIVYSDVAGDVNNNYWSNNDEIKVSDIIKPTSWIILNATISGDDIKQEKEYDIELKFSLNNGSELDIEMPELDIDLSSSIGSVNPTVTMVENKATATYKSDVEGLEVINVGNVTSVEFNVTEDETGKIFVAPNDYERDITKDLGSKANPYSTLTEALSAASAGTEIIMLEGTYTTSSYYTVNKNNIKITGRGKVILTSSSTSNYYFINAGGSSAYSAGYSLTLTNLVFENITVASNYNNQYAVIYYKGYGSYYGTPDYRDLTVINCTFNNNKAYYGAIYSSGYASLNVTGSTFYNNTGTGGAFIYLYSNVQSFNLNYNIFADNKHAGYYGAIRGPLNGNIDYNFWGSNKKPVSYTDYGSISNVNNWVVAEISIDSDNVTYSDTPTVTVKFRYTTDGENYTDLEKSMPVYTFGLSKVLGTLDENVTVENNIGEVTYTATALGEEVIKLNEITNLKFTVGKHQSSVEIIVGSSYFVGDDFSIVVNNNSAVRVTIDNVEYEIGSDGKVVVDTTVFAAGEHTVVATIDENDKYLSNTTSATFVINKHNSSVEIIVGSSYFVGDDFSIVVNNDSVVRVTIDDVEYVVGSDGKVVVDTTVFAAGEHTVVATIDENDKYLSNTTSATFILINSLSVTVEKINEGEKLNITINDEAKTTGTATVTINKVDYSIDVVDGFGNKVLETNLTSGTYDINTVLGNYKNTTSVNIDLRETDFLFEISETTVGQKTTIKVIVPDDLMGDEIIVLVDSTKYVATRENNFTVETDELASGSHSVSAIYSGDDIYDLTVSSEKFTVAKLPTSIEVTSAIINAGEIAEINIKLSENISAEVYVEIDGNKNVVNLVNGSYDLSIANLKVGNYTISISYGGDDTYFACENTTATIVVNYNDAGLKANATDATVGDNVTINVEIDSKVTGNVIVKLGDNEYPVALTNGKGIVTIPNLGADDYIANVIFEGDGMFVESSVNVTFKVSKKELPEDINVSMDIPEGTTAPEFTINLPSDAEGNFTVTVDGKEYTQAVVNGSATVKVPELSVGNHTISSSYSGDDKFAGFKSDNSTVNIPKASIPGGEDAINLTAPEGTDSPTYSINLPGAEGNLTVTVDGKDNYTQALVNGSASVTVPGLSQGDHNIVVTYSGDDKFSGISKNTVFHVPIAGITQNKDVSAICSATASYKVLITKDGKAVGAGEKVVITFNGKSSNVQTDKNGYATLKLNTNVKVKKYTVTAEYKGVKVTNKVTIKHVIKASNKKVKKSKKVTKVKITLKKVNGKYLKKKTLKIKFNKKTYKVKTNKKGVAKWKVKKSMLKKLKVGKKYKYKVTYGKDAVTKKLTIRK